MESSVVEPLFPHGRLSVKRDFVIYFKSAYDIISEDVDH